MFMLSLFHIYVHA